MTGYTVHTGSTEKFSNGWDVIFESRKKAAGKATKKTTSKKKTSKKRASKKRNSNN